jgi:hypothetical protein
MTGMDPDLDIHVRFRARNHCEYCRLPQSASRLKHVIDHIVARQHGGATVLNNLALCCGRCNSHKGPNIAGVDPTTGVITSLFHPRLDRWEEHFRWDLTVLEGMTAVGRTTVVVLAVNNQYRIAAREALLGRGLWPPT